MFATFSPNFGYFDVPSLKVTLNINNYYLIEHNESMSNKILTVVVLFCLIPGPISLTFIGLIRYALIGKKKKK